MQMETALNNQLKMKRIDLLISILAFETCWAYYSMSSGNIYQDDTKKAAINLFEKLEKLREIDKGLYSFKRRTMGESDFRIAEKILEEINEWAKGNTIKPYNPIMQSKVMLWTYFVNLKAHLVRRVGLDYYPWMSLALSEFQHTEKYLRWQPYLPKESMYWYDRELDISKLSNTDTIVVYGDIRRSQDLMIYTIGNERFEEMMIKFFETTRMLFNKYTGIFDKFTGDGFLGYFNAYICNEKGKDFVDCFLGFIKECIEVNKSLFDEWKKHVRKLPAQDIMLSLGADLGNIYFGDRHGHLVCIGDAIVWAQRMCSEAPASAIYVNNLLKNLLSGKKEVLLIPVEGKTKTGESFLASELKYK